MDAWQRASGFTLAEMLTVAALIGVLGAIALPVLNKAQDRAKAVQCATRLKTLSVAALLYANENCGELPRSFHSAGAHRQPGWAVSVSPYLGIPETQIDNDWKGVFNTYYRSPADSITDPYIYSYALNVHFELDPDGDDYTGQPNTWHRLIQVPKPSRTILLAQTRPVMFGDHLMCHQWSGINAARNALNYKVHQGKANYAFADGHVELLPVEATFTPPQNINLWNPSLAQ